MPGLPALKAGTGCPTGPLEGGREGRVNPGDGVLVLEALAQLAAAEAEGGAGFDDTGTATLIFNVQHLKCLEGAYLPSWRKQACHTKRYRRLLPIQPYVISWSVHLGNV